MKSTIRIMAALLALTGFSHAAQARNCVGLGDAYYNDPSGKCYYLETTGVTFSSAQSACLANSGYLVNINDATENATLVTQFSGLGSTMIGLRDTANNWNFVWEEGDLKGQTMWVGDQTGSAPNSRYANWTSGNPNSPGQDCATIALTGSGVWNDLACTDNTQYICELYACQNPLGDQGEVIFNEDARTLQYCNGGMWVAMAQPTYRPVAVTFDGANDYMTSASAQGADSQLLTGSVWIKYNGATNVPYGIVRQNGSGNLSLHYSGGSGNRFEVTARDGAGTIVMQVRCGGAMPTAGFWYHYLFSIDLSDVNKRSCYVSDVSSSSFLTYTTGATMNLDLPNVRIGANNDGPATNKLNGSVADLWLDFGTYMDFSIAGNRRKFIDAAGRPVNLGTTGNIPTGTAPEIFLSGAIGAWNNNKGTAVGYTLTGALTADTPPGAITGADVQTGLVGHWKFDDASGSTTAVNSAGGLPGTLTNMTPASDWVTGRIGGGLDFDGTNDKVVIAPHSAINNVAPVSVCAWVYPRDIPGGSFPTIFDKSSASDGSDGFNFYLVGTGAELGYYSNLADYKQRTPVISINTWQHVCATWNGANGNTNILLYLNGVLSNTAGGQGDVGSTLDDSLRNLNIGGSGFGGQYFNGILDDMRMYNRVLSPAEILSLYQLGASGGNYCSNPSRAPGTLLFNDASNVPQFCDGGTWRALGPVPGPGGAGCTNPARGEGHILFNSASRTMQYCDGVTWRSMPGIGLSAPTAGLVNHWPMEDGAAAMTIDDVVGTNDCSVQVNGGTRASVAGKVGNALQYQQSYAQCGVIAAMHDVTQFTLSAWLKRTNAGDNVYVFEEGGGTSQMGIDFYGNGETYFTLTNPPSTGYEEGNFPLNDTQWHLITMVYNGTLTGDSNRLKGYINGQQVTLNFNGSGIIDPVTGPYATAAQLRLYNLVGTADGAIDDIRVYNRALSAAEVSQLYYATGGQ